MFRVIAEHGLEQFYLCATPAGVSQRAPASDDPSRFAVLDDAIVARRFAQTRTDGSAVATFVVPALHCASCVWLLERLYRLDAGIGRSEVDLLRRTVRVEFAPETTSLRRVAERLASLGYEPLLDPERSAAGMPPARRRLYLKIGVAGFAFGNVMLFSVPRYANGGPLDPEFQRLFDTLNLLFALPVLVYSASDYFRAAWQAMRTRTMQLDVPIALGLLALFGRSLFDIVSGRGEGFFDSFSGLVFFLLIGRLFQQKAFDGIAFDRTVRSFLPLSVRVDRGAVAQVTPLDEIVPGDVITVRPHEVVPADAVLLDERGAIDYAFVTGESTPHAVEREGIVSAGGRVVAHALRLRVLRPVSHSRLSELWNHPHFARTKTHWIATVTSRFAWWFTAGALLLAAAGAVAWWPDAERAVEVATAVLIIACPCALTLAAPMTLGTAMARLGLQGCYLKHPAVALDLSRIDTIAFDKTGTLTTAAGEAQVMSGGFTADDWARIRRLAAESVHPVSRAIAGRDEVAGRATAVVEEPGAGLSGTVDGERVVIGTPAFVSRRTGQTIPPHDERTWAAVGHRRAGWILVEARGRPGLDAAIRSLSARYRVWLLSGDAVRDVERWMALFGRRLRFRLSPEAKLADVRRRQSAGAHVLMVGDGLNDAGALAAADVGLAVSDDTACLVPACDGVIRGDRLGDLPAFLTYAQRARLVIFLCFAVSVIYNALGLTLALAGRLSPLVTAILMPVSSLTVIGLAVGLMRRGPVKTPA